MRDNERVNVCPAPVKLLQLLWSYLVMYIVYILMLSIMII